MKYSEIVKNFAENRFGTEVLSMPEMKSIHRMDLTNPIYTNWVQDFSEKNYGQIQKPVDLGKMNLDLPLNEMYVLRMPICFNYKWKIPVELKFLKNFISYCYSYNGCNFGNVFFPFVYITIRHSEQKDKLTDVWHVDGFQGKERHIPEVSYIWTDKSATEWAIQSFNIPASFDPKLHNFFSVLEPQIKSVIKQELNHIMMFNPYHVHRKEKGFIGNRTMIRLTFSPVEIKDPNYTTNPNFNLVYNKSEPRDELKVLNDSSQ